MFNLKGSQETLVIFIVVIFLAIVALSLYINFIRVKCKVGGCGDNGYCIPDIGCQCDAGWSGERCVDRGISVK